jgi:hypothetical protein
MTSTIKVNNIQNQCGANIINESSNTITIGASGDTVSLASGASQSGFGRTGTVDWQTGDIKTGNFTASNGEGYFVNTTSGVITVNLPASPSAGNIVAVADYAGTAASNVITIDRNGSNIEGGTTNASIDVARESKTFVYVDGTQGWIVVNSNDTSTIPPDFLSATGGTVTTVGDYKIHTFTGPGTFTVCQAGGVAANNVVSYLVVAGGASGGASEGGGGGAGGFREYKSPVDCYSASPLNGNPGGTAITVNAQAYPITVGAGGASRPCTPSANGENGSNSTFSTITSAGGGGGGSNKPGCTPGSAVANSGGSGGGSRRDAGNPTAAAGNTPSVTPPQGNNGGTTPSTNWHGAGGGGGAGAVGSNGTGNGSPSGENAGNGGAGVTTSINNSPTTYAGGGGGSINGSSGNIGTGGPGGGGNGSQPPACATSGTANTGGGGGGATSKASGGGGSGIVIIRYKYQ